MTPDRRLDQLEPLMADSLQKIDHLIEGQGQLVELATKTDQKVDALDRKVDQKVGAFDQKIDALDRKVDQKIDVVDQKADTIAKGVAELTITTQRQYAELKAGQEAIMQYLREKLP